MRPTKPGMEDISAQSRAGHCRYGLVRRPDHQLQPSLCLCYRTVRPQRAHLGRCHGESNGRVDCASNNRSVSLGRCTAISHSRSGSDLRHLRHAPPTGHGHTRQAYGASLTMAEWLCRTADRLDPARVCLIVLGEAHLRRILRAYARYYNDIRTHWSLAKDAPLSRPIQRIGSIRTHPMLGGLHYHYIRV